MRDEEIITVANGSANGSSGRSDTGCTTDQKVSAPVIIYPYNTLWPGLYEKERDIIMRTLGPGLMSLEHIGSTSVPGLISKNIIDIMAGVADRIAAEQCLSRLPLAGYDNAKDLDHPEWFCLLYKRLEGAYCHLHIVKEGREHQWRHIAFRDWLCSHPEDAGKYEQLKIRLAETYRNDRVGYINAKSEFIVEILERLEKNE